MNFFKIIFWPIVKSVVINTVIILAFAGLFEGSIKIENPLYGFYGALLITLMYRFIRPMLMLLSIVPIILTFGIFIVVINAGLIMLTSLILSPNFVVPSFGTAFVLAIFISILNSWLFPGDRKVIIKKLK